MSRLRCLIALWIAVNFALGGTLPRGAGPALADASGPAGCAGEADGLIIYGQFLWSGTGDDRAITGEQIVVARPDGTEVQRITLPDGSTDLPIVPLGIGCLDLVSGAIDDTPVAWIVDPAAGTLRPVSFPSGAPTDRLVLSPFARRTHPGQRYTLLSTGRQDSLVLLDTQTAVATDIGALIRELSGGASTACCLTGIELTPDESHMTVSALDRSESLWLLPTADPRSGRAITPARFGSFSPDGQRILYLQPPGQTGGDYWLVTEALDGSGNEIVATGNASLRRQWVPSGESAQVLVQQIGSVELLDLATHQARQLLALGEDDIPDLWGFAPSGQRALIGTLASDDAPARWFWVDLTAGTSLELDALAGRPRPALGSSLPTVAGAAQWVAFLPTDEPSVAAGDTVLGLDMATGAVRRLLRFEHDSRAVSLAPSASGRYAALADVGRSDTLGWWLLDAATGTNRWFPDGLGASFSPDETHVIWRQKSDACEPGCYDLVISPTSDGADAVFASSVSLYGHAWLPYGPPAPATG